MLSQNFALPVTWVAYDAKKDAQQNVQLQWQTANESNALQYEVQVSTNGIEFETIGIVAAKNAAAATYFFTDKTEGKTGIRMYRIKQTDRDGQFSFSAVRSIQFGSIRTSIHTYPNPVQNQLLLAMVHNAPIQVQWQISDAAGRIVMNGKWQSNATADKKSINTQQLQPGVYTITVTDGTQRWYHKMVKAN